MRITILAATLTIIMIVVSTGCSTFQDIWDNYDEWFPQKPVTPDEPAAPVDPADPGVPVSDEFPAGLKWLHTDVSRWAVTATLRSVTVSGNEIRLDYDKASVWPGRTDAGTAANVNANPWVIVTLDGKPYAATWEWFKPGQTTKAKKAVTGSYIKKSPLNNWSPSKGERLGFFVSGLARGPVNNVKARSNVVWILWP